MTAAAPARILVVDDEPDNRALLEIVLSNAGFIVVTAADGEEALSAVAAQAPDLILLDVIMYGLDGYEVTARLKANAATRAIPIILLTALDDRSTRVAGANAGAQDVLSKPFDRAELFRRVRAQLPA